MNKDLHSSKGNFEAELYSDCIFVVDRLKNKVLAGYYFTDGLHDLLDIPDYIVVKEDMEGDGKLVLETFKGKTWAYRYDDQDRLIWNKNPSGTEYKYDEEGNMTWKKDEKGREANYA